MSAQLELQLARFYGRQLPDLAAYRDARATLVAHA
jgi:hypothetical protein